MMGEAIAKGREGSLSVEVEIIDVLSVIEGVVGVVWELLL